MPTFFNFSGFAAATLFGPIETPSYHYNRNYYIWKTGLSIEMGAVCFTDFSPKILENFVF